MEIKLLLANIIVVVSIITIVYFKELSKAMMPQYIE